MKMLSTRGGASVSAAHSIVCGLAPDGGLYVPETLPKLPPSFAADMASQTYARRAQTVLAPFLPTYAHLADICTAAYGERFTHPSVAPVRAIDGATHLLELFHGPTLAFKDMALQIMPHLLAAGAAIENVKDEALILVATSGDTGKAALEGFCDAPGVRIAVYYPEEGVSAMQKLQMQTQRGGNVAVIAVRGNFDDAQTGVKRMFADEALATRLRAKNIAFSSANSINWGRLAPQIAYYASAYADVAASGALRDGQALNVCVPTGNFGNILAAYYAKRMGVPLGKLICASNRNRVLADFIQTGVYDRRREFFATTSPSMDILVSSNLERLLFELFGRDAAAVRMCMDDLAQKGVYDIGESARSAVQGVFEGGWCDDAQAGCAIAETWQQSGVLLDPHTAVAAKVLGDYRKSTGDATPTLIVATASPYKFAPSVLRALNRPVPDDDFAACDALAACTGIPAPKAIAELKGLPVRHSASCEKNDMDKELLQQFGGLL